MGSIKLTMLKESGFSMILTFLFFLYSFQAQAQTLETGWQVYPGALKQVAVGPYGVWGVIGNGTILKKTSNSWEQVDGELQDISVGGNSVWGVNSVGDIWMRVGEDGGWTQIEGKLKQVSVSGLDDSVVWGVNPQNETRRWKGGNNWEQISGGLTVVSCGQSGVWGVSHDDKILYRNGTYGGGSTAGSEWQEVDGRLVWISSGSDGEVWGVNKDAQIYQRDGITQANPVGSGWKQVPGELIKVSVWAGQAWGVNKDDIIFSKSFVSGKPKE